MLFKYIKLMCGLYTCRDGEREEKFLKLFLPNFMVEKRIKEGRQHSTITCEKCGLELTSTSWIAEWKEDKHTYCCNYCGEIVTYHFGIAPVAIKVDETE